MEQLARDTLALTSTVAHVIQSFFISQEFADGFHEASPVPPNISYEQASTLSVVLTCAYVGLYNQNPRGLGIAPPIFLKRLKKIMLELLSLSLGVRLPLGRSVTLQLAKLSGFSPIVATVSLKHAEFLKSLGATHILDWNLQSNSLITEITKVTAKPINYVYDTVASAGTQQLGLDIVASGGQIATVLPVSVQVPADKTFIPVLGFLRLPENIALLETLYHDKISGFLEQGIIKPNNVEVLPGGLSGIVGGLERMEANLISGLKLVVRPQETS